MLQAADLLETRTARIRIAGGPVDTPISENDPPKPLLEVPENNFRVEAQLSEWARAGADVLLAPTLRATPEGLKPIGLAHRAGEVNRVLLEAVRQASLSSLPPPWVAAQVGPLGKAFRGGGFFSFDEAYIHYHEQAKAIALLAPDMVVVRQIQDLRLLRAAIVAIRELWSGLVVVFLDMAAVNSASPARERLMRTALVVRSLDVQGIGLEGFGDPSALGALALPLKGQGFSLLGAVLDHGSGSLAEKLAAFERARVNLAILEGEDGLRDLWAMRSARHDDRGALREDTPPGVPEVLAAGPVLDLEPPRRLLVSLEAEWDVRPGGPREEAEAPEIPRDKVGFSGIRIESGTADLEREGWRRREIEERLSALERTGGKPLALLVRDPLVLETGLKAASDRPIIYLDSLDTALWQSVFYLSTRYGAMLAVRLAPAPTRPGERCASGSIQAIQRLVHASREYSRLSPEDIYVDPLGLDSQGRPAWDQETLQSILKQMPPAKRETGVKWILDCHHFRKGPGAIENPAYQAWLLSIALFQGLDAVLVAPDQPHLTAIIDARED